MRGFTEITAQDEMEALLDRVAGSHDSLVKELYVVNRAYVMDDHSMAMTHRFDVRLLIQSQFKPYAIELLFIDVNQVNVEKPDECYGAVGAVTRKFGWFGVRTITMKFDDSLTVSAGRLFFLDRPGWLGEKARLGAEVPHPDCVPAVHFEDLWRQCSSCAEVFEAGMEEEYVLCPNCGVLTEFTPKPDG